MRKIRYHCGECGHNFRIPAAAESYLFRCPKCGSNWVVKGWKEERKEDSGINAKLKMFGEVIA